MRPFLALSLLLVCLLLPAATLSAESPEFRLGFKELAQKVPDVVGDPVENETHNPANGDALQKTTTGLMVWRKADNWTAFTNGSRSWVSGPFGLQERANDERFEWEMDEVPAIVSRGPAAPATPSATASPASRGIRSPEPAGEWVTSAAPSTKYYTSKDNPYWKSWSAGNRVWFAGETDLKAAYPGRVRK